MPNNRVCSIEGCNRKLFAKGWCGTHYKRAKGGRLRSDVAIRPYRKNYSKSPLYLGWRTPEEQWQIDNRGPCGSCS